MTLQDLFNIACRHLTAMADAMRAACLTKAYETGEPIVLRRDAQAQRARGKAAARAAADEETDRRRMVEGNTDTRLQHV